MNNRSESLVKLLAALNKFQAEVQPIPLDSTNPAFRSKYASLSAIWEQIRKPLTNNGLVVTQHLMQGDTNLVLETYLHHISGEYLASSMPILHPQNVTAQMIGSWITYARRYTLLALLGLVADTDDDGNDASTSTGTYRPRQSQAPQQKGGSQPAPQQKGNGQPAPQRQSQAPQQGNGDIKVIEVEDDGWIAIWNSQSNYMVAKTWATKRIGKDIVENMWAGVFSATGASSASNAEAFLTAWRKLVNLRKWVEDTVGDQDLASATWDTTWAATVARGKSIDEFAERIAESAVADEVTF